MMKRLNKITVLTISSLLALGTITTSLALFKNLDDGGDILIQEKVNVDPGFTIGDVQAVGDIIDPNHSIVHEYTLGIDKSGGYKQDTIATDLSFSVKIDGFTTSEEYKAFFETYNINMSIAGYSKDSWCLKRSPYYKGDGIYNIKLNPLYGNQNISELTFMSDCFAYKEGQKLKLEFKMKENSTFKDIAKFNVNKINYKIELKQPSYYDDYLIRGIFNGKSNFIPSNIKEEAKTISANYLMVPDLDSSVLRYKYENLALSTGDEFMIIDCELSEFKLVGTGTNKDQPITVAQNVNNQTATIYYDGQKVFSPNDIIFNDIPNTNIEPLEIYVVEGKNDFRVGEKAHIEFRSNGKKIVDKSRLCGHDMYDKAKISYSSVDKAYLNQWDDYVTFSKPGQVEITFESTYYTKASVAFNVRPRDYAPDKINLAVSTSADEIPFMKEVAARYNATLPSNKQINFIFEDHREDQIYEDVLDWREGPNLFAYTSDMVHKLYKAGAFSRNFNRMNNDSTLKNSFTKGALEAASFPAKGNYIGYPYACKNGYFLYYNKAEVNEEQVTSIEGLLDLANSKNKEVAYPLNTSFYSAGALFTYGSRFTTTFDANGKLAGVNADFDSPQGIKAGKAILKIMSHPAYQERQEVPTKESRLIACVDGDWYASRYKQALGKDFGCAKLPTVTIDGDTKNLSSYIGYNLYGINGASSNIETMAAASDFGKYLVSKEIQEYRLQELGLAPTNKEVVISQTVQNDALLKAITDQAEIAVAQKAIPSNMWSAPSVFTQAIINCMVNELNIDEYMKKLNVYVESSKTCD